MIQILVKIMPIICIMFLVVITFTNALICLLRNTSDQFFQEQYQGESVDVEDSSLESNLLTTVYNTGLQMDISHPFKAFITVWLFIFGVFDPVNGGHAGDDTMIIILTVLFSFITILIFFNMMIALMSSSVEGDRQQENVAR